MSTPTIIIDGKAPDGKRLSVSVDTALWALYSASRNCCSKEARRQIKERMRLGLICNTYDAKRWIYTEIAQPTLLEAVDSLELA